MIIDTELQQVEQYINQPLITYDNSTYQYKFDTIADIQVRVVAEAYKIILDSGLCITVTSDQIIYTDRGHLLTCELLLSDYIQTQSGWVGIDTIIRTKVCANGISIIMSNSDNYCLNGVVLGAY